jgi:hypothetical protein
LTVLLLPILMLLLQGQALSDERENRVRGKSDVEAYRYKAVPIGQEDDTEDIEAVLSFEVNDIVFSSKSVSRKAEERIGLKMTMEGNLISGTRSFTKTSEKRTEARIWRDADKVYIEQTSGEGKKTKALEVPHGATLAVEASLMVLFRCFPCELTTPWPLFIIDFAGQSINATARQTGVERITVPAGEFSCYRIEVVFHVFLLNPKVVCWVTQEKPHVLVKSVGKRGLFTPTYVTSLVGQQVPAVPTRKTKGETSLN